MVEKRLGGSARLRNVRRRRSGGRDGNIVKREYKERKLKTLLPWPLLHSKGVSEGILH